MRRGFTLIELLIVLAVILCLMALLVPDIQGVREASSVVMCRNNMMRIGQAIHNYRDYHGYFPRGTMPQPLLPHEERLSWHITLLPYLEANRIYVKFDPKAAFNAPRNVAAEKDMYIHTFRCISFKGPWKNYPITNYVGIAGIGADVATLPLDGPGVGFFGYDRMLTREGIKDGTANTIAAIETERDMGGVVRGGRATVRGIDLDDAPLFGAKRPFGGLHIADKPFAQTKSLGTMVLMVDGRVHQSKVSIDPFVFGSLLTIAGDDAVPAEW